MFLIIRHAYLGGQMKTYILSNTAVTQLKFSFIKKLNDFFLSYFIKIYTKQCKYIFVNIFIHTSVTFFDLKRWINCTTVIIVYEKRGFRLYDDYTKLPYLNFINIFRKLSYILFIAKNFHFISNKINLFFLSRSKK